MIPVSSILRSTTYYSTISKSSSSLFSDRKKFLESFKLGKKKKRGKVRSRRKRPSPKVFEHGHVTSRYLRRFLSLRLRTRPSSGPTSTASASPTTPTPPPLPPPSPPPPSRTSRPTTAAPRDRRETRRPPARSRSAASPCGEAPPTTPAPPVPPPRSSGCFARCSPASRPRPWTTREPGHPCDLCNNRAERGRRLRDVGWRWWLLGRGRIYYSKGPPPPL